MGSAMGLAGNLAKGFRDISMGNTMGGVRALLPAALRNPFEAAMMAQHGYLNSSGAQQPIQPSTADVVMKAIGVEPASAVRNEDIQTQAERTLDLQRYVSGYLSGNLKRAMAYGDPQGVQDISQQAMQYNMQHPGLHLNPTQIIQEMQHQNMMARGIGMPAVGASPNDIRLRQQIAPYYNPQQ